MGYQLLGEPYTKAEIERQLEHHGFVTGVVAVSFYDIVNDDLEGLNDEVERQLVETGILMDIDYEVVGTGLLNQIHLRVTAQVELTE